jgi:hypothetical protein
LIDSNCLDLFPPPIFVRNDNVWNKYASLALLQWLLPFFIVEWAFGFRGQNGNASVTPTTQPNLVAGH